MISRYTIDREVNGIVKNYQFKLCWGCGHFAIYPNIVDEFTNLIMRDQTIIIELIKGKLLKPIL